MGFGGSEPQFLHDPLAEVGDTRGYPSQMSVREEDGVGAFDRYIEWDDQAARGQIGINQTESSQGQPHAL